MREASLAISELEHPLGETVKRSQTERCWRIASITLLCVISAIVLLTFRDYAVSNDEWVQHVYGEKLLHFYLSGFADRQAFAFKDLFYYGGLFDLLAVGLTHALPLSTPETRHLLSATFGIFGLIGTCRCGEALFGARAGFLAALVLALTGPWWGGMFNNTKDIPFATTMIWALFTLCRVAETLPRPSMGRVLAFGLFLGLSFGLRVGAALLLLYTANAALLWLASASGASASPGERVRMLGGAAARLLPAFVVAYGLMAVLWPWAVLDPFNPIRALRWFSHLDLGIQTMLHGRIYDIDALPRTYLPVYLAIKLPLLFLLGLAAGAGAGLVRLTRKGGSVLPPPKATGVVIVVVAAIFPILYFVVMRPPAYDGIRHFLFAVPPLAVLAGAGLDHLIAWPAAKLPRPLAALGSAVVAVLVVVQAGRLVRLHPHQYLDYNVFVGGPKGAQDRYVMDYWANAVPEAIAGLDAYLRAQFADKPPDFKVYVCANRWTFEAAAPTYLKWTNNFDAADFFIAPRDMFCDEPLGWPHRSTRGTVLYRVERLGAVLAVVKDHRAGPGRYGPWMP